MPIIIIVMQANDRWARMAGCEVGLSTGMLPPGPAYAERVVGRPPRADGNLV
jgi:hypothetical protein